MKAVALLALVLAACGLVPLAPPLPSDTATRAIIVGDNVTQCSAVVLNEHIAITARHCTPPGQGILVLLPEGPLPVADTAPHEDKDVALLLTQVPLPPPYAKLGPAPTPGDTVHLEGYGCDRAIRIVPQFSTRELTYIGREPATQDFVLSGLACHGDSGGGIFNAAGELVGVNYAIAKDGDDEYVFATPVQFLTDAAQSAVPVP